MPGAFAPIVDKAELELFVGNTPPATSEFVLINFLNAAMAQVSVTHCTILCIALPFSPVARVGMFTNLL
jgi:hypothetical protein